MNEASSDAPLRRTFRGSRDALGIVETTTVAATLGAADRGLKEADVDLVELKLADRLGGKAYCVFSGTVADSQAAVEAAVESLEDPSTLVAEVVIPDFHDEMLANLEATPEFWPLVDQEEA